MDAEQSRSGVRVWRCSNVCRIHDGIEKAHGFLEGYV